MYFQGEYSIDSLYITEPLSGFDSVISLRLHGGWGNFDYMANIYNGNDGYNAELFQYVDREPFSLNDSLLQQSKRGYARMKHSVITGEDWKILFNALDKNDYWCTEHYANQCHTTVDGEQWTLSVKFGENKHTVFWQDCFLRKKDTLCINRCMEMEDIANQIFKAAGFTRNRYVVASKEGNKGKDSIVYNVFAPVYYPNQAVFYHDKELMGTITVARKDKDWVQYLEIQEQYASDTIRYKPLHVIFEYR